MPQQREQEEEKREGERQTETETERKKENEHQMQRDDTVIVYMSKWVRYQKWEQEKTKSKNVEGVCSYVYVSEEGSLWLEQ